MKITAKILDGYTCRDCGQQIIEVFFDFNKDVAPGRMRTCPNENCKNHKETTIAAGNREWAVIQEKDNGQERMCNMEPCKSCKYYIPQLQCNCYGESIKTGRGYCLYYDIFTTEKSNIKDTNGQ